MCAIVRHGKFRFLLIMGDVSCMDNTPDGILRKTKGLVSVEWDISNYKALYNARIPNVFIPKIVKFAGSPTFKIRDATWSLGFSHACLRPKKSKTVVRIELFKHSSEKKHRSITCQMTLQMNGDEVCGGCTRTYRRGERILLFKMGITEAELLDSKSVDALKVVCTFYPDVEEETPSNLTDKGIDTLSSHMKDLFLKSENCDFKIKVKDRCFQVHKAIVSARSPVLSAMLQGDMAQKNNDTIDIVDCDPGVFQHFLVYLYSDQLEEICWGNVREFYSLGDKYVVPRLKKECLQFMEGNMCVDKFCDAIALAVKHKESTLVKSATDFYVKNADSILRTNKWQLLLDKNLSLCNELFMKYAQSQPPEEACGGGKALGSRAAQGLAKNIKSKKERTNSIGDVTNSELAHCSDLMMLGQQLARTYRS